MGVMAEKNKHHEKKRIWHPIHKRFLKILAWIESAQKGKSVCRG